MSEWREAIANILAGTILDDYPATLETTADKIAALDADDFWPSFLIAHARDTHGCTHLADPPADSLDAAWAEAEAALPEGHTMDLVLENHVDGGRYLAWTMRHTDTAIIRGEGPTPAAALRALTARLRERAG